MRAIKHGAAILTGLAARLPGLLTSTRQTPQYDWFFQTLLVARPEAPLSWLLIGSHAASVKKNPQWHITMTYHVSSGYVMEICRDDISIFDMSWWWHDSNHTLTLNDMCHDIAWWCVLMTPHPMTYLMTYDFDSTLQGHIRITHQFHEKWTEIICHGICH